VYVIRPLSPTQVQLQPPPHRSPRARPPSPPQAPQDTFGNTDITNGRCYHQDRNYQEDNNGEKARRRCKGASQSSNMD